MIINKAVYLSVDVNLERKKELLGIWVSKNEGRIEAKSKGIKFGRKRKIDRDKLLKYKENGIGTALAKEMRICRAGLCKILKEESGAIVS